MSDTSSNPHRQAVDLDELRRLRGAGLFLLTVQYIGSDDDTNSKHTFWAVAVPRVGEIISPQVGRYTEVLSVMHRPFAVPGLPPGQQHLLCPFVLVKDVPEPEFDV